MVRSMTFTTSLFFKSLSEEIRLFSVLLLQTHRELCVCELEFALAQSQPKISRHLSQLRNLGILTDQRKGQWVYYSLNPELPTWALDVISNASHAERQTLETFSLRLKNMPNRPGCC